MTLKATFVGALCLAAAASSAQAAQPRYTLQSLGEYWNGVGINSANQIAGNDTIHNSGLIYQAGETRGLVAASARSSAAGINSAGIVAGSDTNHAGVSRATRWVVPEEPQDLGVLPGGTFSFAAGINDAGQVVGSSSYDAEGIRTLAFIWNKGKLKALSNLPGSIDSGATAINAKGQVAGWSSAAGTQTKHAVRWTRGVIEDLGFLAGASDEYSYATAINRRGDVVGGATGSNGYLRPFLFRAGPNSTMVDLGTLYGAESETCKATGINYAREVVGWCNDWVTFRSGAFLYRGGRLQPLNKFLDSSGAGWYVYAAFSIDDQGRILAAANDPEGKWHPVLLTPVGR